MSDTMTIEDYLAQGGVLTSPANAPARYRGELLRLMATFVDSELAASAGFADAINASPGITARIAAARITLEKADHADVSNTLSNRRPRPSVVRSLVLVAILVSIAG